MKPRLSQIAVLVAFVGMAVAAMLSSCACTTWQDSAGKSLASASVSVDAAMKGWAVWVANGHATLEQEAKVRDAYGKYQAAMRLASNTYQSAVAAKDKSLMKIAMNVVAESRQSFLALIAEFTQRKAAP